MIKKKWFVFCLFLSVSMHVYGSCGSKPTFGISSDEAGQKLTYCFNVDESFSIQNAPVNDTLVFNGVTYPNIVRVELTTIQDLTTPVATLKYSKDHLTTSGSSTSFDVFQVEFTNNYILSDDNNIQQFQKLGTDGYIVNFSETTFMIQKELTDGRVLNEIGTVLRDEDDYVEGASDGFFVRFCLDQSTVSIKDLINDTWINPCCEAPGSPVQCPVN